MNTGRSRADLILYQFRLHRNDGVGSGESGVGGCGIIDFDSIVPIQPETISKCDRISVRGQSAIEFL